MIKDGDGAGSGGTKGEAQTQSDRSAMLSSSAFAPPLPAENGASTGAVPRRLMRSVNNHAQNGAAGSAPSAGPMVNLTPLTAGGPRGAGSNSNVNPAMNASAGHVHVMNVLDARVPPAGNALSELAQTDSAFLEGIPAHMFDWGTYQIIFLCEGCF